MRPIILTIPKKLVEKFKKKARERFPIELYAVLIGHDLCDKIEVLDFYYPNFKSDAYYVWCEAQGYLDAAEHASELGLSIVGDVHSHCFEYKVGIPIPWRADHAKSEEDHAWGHKLRVQGICKVVEYAKKRRRATTRFWGPTIPVDCRFSKSHTLIEEP